MCFEIRLEIQTFYTSGDVVRDRADKKRNRSFPNIYSPLDTLVVGIGMDLLTGSH